MRRKSFVVGAFLLSGILSASVALAGDVKTSLGLGIGAAPDYEGSEDYEAVVLPYARIAWGDQGHYVSLFGNQLRANLLSETWKLGPVLQYRPERDSVDNNRVKRMKDVDSTVEGGLFLGYESGPWWFDVEAVADLSDEHDGYLVTLSGGYTCTAQENLKLTTAVYTTYASDDYMETYFQIDANNVGRSGLPMYNADDGILKDVGISLTGDYSLNNAWSLLGIVSYTRLLSDAADSPIVDDEGDANQMFAAVFGIYHF